MEEELKPKRKSRYEYIFVRLHPDDRELMKELVEHYQSRNEGIIMHHLRLAFLRNSSSEEVVCHTLS